MWNLTSDTVVSDVSDNDFHDSHSLHSSHSNGDDLSGEEFKNNETSDTGTMGILKKSRSFENLRNPTRRVSFVNEDDLPPSSSSSSVGSLGQTEREGSPDIQVLSRSRIYPADHWVSGNTDGETVLCSEDGSEEKESASSEDISPSQQSIKTLLVNSQSNREMNSSQNHGRTLTDQPHISNDNPNKLDVHIVCSNGTALLDENNPVRSPQSHIPVDLVNFGYSAADIIYMKRLMSLQVNSVSCCT